MNKFKLHIGDYSDNGQITIVDEDRLCYLVQSASRGASGLRTISKALLKEFVDFVQAHPEASPRDCRDALSGVSGIDKYEYGYDSTLLLMAKMILGKESIKHKTFKKVLLHNDSTTLFVWDCIKLFNEKNELKELLESQWTETIDGNVADYITVNGCYVARCGDSDQYQSIKIYDGRILNCGFDARNIRAFAETINQIYSGRYRIEIENNLNDDEIYNLIELSSFDGSKYLPYLTALRTKPFMLLAGISGTGKSRIVRELAFKSCPDYLQDKDGTTPGNYCMIEVKPNWHDSSELLGYYSNIAKGYQFSKFVKFLVKAMMFPKVPFFVCMDEMNLAPVEQYFAEFLSVLETRKKAGDTIQSGVLVDAQYFKGYKFTDSDGHEHEKVNMSDLDWYEVFFDKEKFSDEEKALVEKFRYERVLQEKGLKLPANVFIIGTVNMDDTTHQFSRKVIDRAMTIEMNGEDLTKMFDGTNNLEYLPKDQEWVLAQFQSKYVSADEVLKAHADEAETLKEQLTQRLTAINNELKDTPFVVSYRVLNELIIYAGVLLDDKKPLQEAIDTAVDRITLMKILPRIEGDEDMLGLATDENNRLCKLMPLVGEESRKKLKEMNNRLKTGFTRFWP